MLNNIKNAIWGIPTLAIIVILGIKLIKETHARALLHPIKVFKNTILSIDSNKSAFKSMCTALGGTIGVGNTVGVAAAIYEGGAGALFWMLVAGVLGITIKEAEIFLAVKFKPAFSKFSGPMYYIEKGIGSKAFARFWCFTCIFTSLGMGNAAQSMAVTTSFNEIFSIKKYITALLLATLILIILSGGGERIKNFSTAVVPFLTVLFILACIIILFFQRSNLIPAIEKILTSSFNAKSGVAGFKWAGFSAAIRAGFSRGIFTNEAGLGSASIVHSSSTVTDCEKQAMWGIVEVFIDTILICFLTGLVILTSNIDISIISPEKITLIIFKNVFGNVGGIFYSFSMVFFAVASIIAWYFYAQCALDYLNADSYIKKSFLTLFILTVFIGGVFRAQNTLIISDIFNGLMLLFNVSALLLLSKKAKIN